MEVYEVNLAVKLKKNIEFDSTALIIAKILDKRICDKLGEDYHTSKNFKEYVFDNFKNFEADRIYKKGKNYIFRIRTIRKEFCDIFFKLEDYENSDLVVLKTDYRILERKIIDKLYTLTPALLKQVKSETLPDRKAGYWKISGLSIKEFNQLVQVNALRKYQFFTNKSVEFWEENKENPFFEGIIFKKNGIKQTYKFKTFYTDKFEIVVKKDKLSQDIAYMLLGAGILHNNSRGCGFLIPRYILKEKIEK